MKALYICAFHLALLGCICFSQTTPTNIATTYTVTDLGPGFDVASINAAGQIAGTLNTCSNGSCTSRALLFSGGTFTDLGTLNGANSVAQAVNASGEVVGYIGVIPYSHAALFASGNVTDLGLLPGGTFTFATDINNNGEVVGWGDVPGGYIHSFTWQPGSGGLVDIGAPPIQSFPAAAVARSVNRKGKIVGNAFFESFNAGHAFLWTKDVFEDLGVLPGDTSSYATDINDLGKVVGVSMGDSGGDAVLHAFLYSAGQMTSLGSITGDIYTVANSINKVGIAVGFGQPAGLVPAHALIFVKDKVHDLNTLVPADSMHLGDARGINVVGQIAGLGLPAGEPSLHGFLLTPVPQK